jgi:hypothetical protein
MKLDLQNGRCDGKRLPVKVIDEGGEERQGNHRPSQLGHCRAGPHARFIRITARGMLFTASHRVLLKRSFLPRNKDILIQAEDLAGLVQLHEATGEPAIWFVTVQSTA